MFTSTLRLAWRLVISSSSFLKSGLPRFKSSSWTINFWIESRLAFRIVLGRFRLAAQLFQPVIESAVILQDVRQVDQRHAARLPRPDAGLPRGVVRRPQRRQVAGAPPGCRRSAAVAQRLLRRQSLGRLLLSNGRAGDGQRREREPRTNLGEVSWSLFSTPCCSADISAALRHP